MSSIDDIHTSLGESLARQRKAQQDRRAAFFSTVEGQGVSQGSVERFLNALGFYEQIRAEQPKGCWVVWDPMACQGNGVMGVHSVHLDELSARRAAMGEHNETSMVVQWAQWGEDLYDAIRRERRL